MGLCLCSGRHRLNGCHVAIAFCRVISFWHHSQAPDISHWQPSTHHCKWQRFKSGRSSVASFWYFVFAKGKVSNSVISGSISCPLQHWNRELFFDDCPKRTRRSLVSLLFVR